MHRIRETRALELMQGSLKSTMGEPLVARISELIAGHRELSISPDVVTSGHPALRGVPKRSLRLRLQSSVILAFGEAKPVPTKY